MTLGIFQQLCYVDVYAVHQHRKFLGFQKPQKFCLAVEVTIDHQDVFGSTNAYRNWCNLKTKWTVLFALRC